MVHVPEGLGIVYHDVQQGTEGWFALRGIRITGSVVGAVLGVNPWKTADEALRDLVRQHHGAEREFKGNVATSWGSNHEAEAILAAERKHGIEIKECGIFHRGRELGASPDGLIGDDGVFEVKCPFGLRNKFPAPFVPLREKPWYYAQVQMELYCTGRKWALYQQYVPAFTADDGTEHPAQLSEPEEILPDQEWLDDALPKIEAFYERVQSELDNPRHLASLDPIDLTSSVEAQIIVSEILAAKAAEAEAKDRYKKLLVQLRELSGDADCDVGKHKLRLVDGRKSVSYATAIKELLPDADLGPYTKTTKPSWRFT